MSAKKNIIVCGYPKSGTTWATRLIAQLLDCPAAGHWGCNLGSPVTEGMDRISDYQCFQAHEIYKEILLPSLPAAHKIIYIIRDPRDVVISGMYHFTFYHNFIYELPKINKISKFNGAARRLSSLLYTRNMKLKRMIKIVTAGDPFISSCKHSWEKHIESFLDKDVLLIKYEDLLADGVQTAIQILNFIGYKKSFNEIKQNIISQSFQNKKKHFIRAGELEKSQHLRTGKQGDWQNHLSNKENQHIVSSLNQYMKMFSYI